MPEEKEDFLLHKNSVAIIFSSVFLLCTNYILCPFLNAGGWYRMTQAILFQRQNWQLPRTAI